MLFRLLALPPGSCVFVDDYEANVAAARAVGMQAILFRIDRGDDLAALLGELGVRPSR